jgi:hypothetical protein
VAAALELSQPPARPTAPRTSLLDPYRDQIEALLAKYHDLSAVRICEEIARGPQGYTGSASILRRYVRHVRPARGRVYQEVHLSLLRRCRSIGTNAAACRLARLCVLEPADPAVYDRFCYHAGEDSHGPT